MATVKCAGCGELIEIPPELTPENWTENPFLEEPVYCDACESDMIEQDGIYDVAVDFE